MYKPTFELERRARADGHAVIADCDEAGRGAIAGPIVAAAVILDPSKPPTGIDDSKLLSPAERARLFDELARSSVIGVAVADVKRIDRDNVLRCSLWAMANDVGRLPIAPDLSLIDGPFDLEQCLIRGDQVSLSIADASIGAKVTRDRMMVNLSLEFRAYGFDRHMGYGTQLHLRALRVFGPSVHHRYSCEIVRAAAKEALQEGPS